MSVNNTVTLEEMKCFILNSVYPIGSIYISTKNTSPQSFLGGTWTPWGAGRVPVGVNSSDTDFNAVEKTGGEKTHKLTTAEMPSHEHSALEHHLGDEGVESYNDLKYSYVSNVWSDYTTNHNNVIGKTGGDQAHNNLQPYICCYMWKRTA